MSIPPDIQILINRLNQELGETEQEATEGLNLLRGVISRFPENVILIQYFAYLNALLLFGETSRRQIQNTIEIISLADVPVDVIHSYGQDLGTLLGKVIEEKMRVSRILNFLRDLP